MRKTTTTQPSFSPFEVQETVFLLYGFKVQVKQLVSYDDQNFLLSTDEGRRFIFKIAHGAESVEVLDLQNRAMQHLDKQAGHDNYPRVTTSLNGNLIETVKNRAGEKFLARMLTFLSGNLLSNFQPHSQVLMENFGKFLGEMDGSLAKFNHPAMHRDLDWDLKNALRVLPHTQFIENPQQQRLAEYFFLQFETEIYPKLSTFRRQVIHNDANDFNVLVDKKRISGIIDFGDLIYTCQLFEPAIACAYAIMRKNEPLTAAAHIIRGYHSKTRLTENEVDALFYSIAARLAVTVSFSAKNSRENPENEYITASERPAWELLEKLISVNPERARQIFREACDMPVSRLGRNKSTILQRRREHISNNLSISYRQPLKIIRGAMQYLFDDSGKTYLDCVNNVCHVGHCHPRVVRALRDQAARLNTNTRYLHDHIVAYAERLTATLPDPLNVCFFVNSGSEANDLALRLARNFTGEKDCIVIDAAYHGHLSSLIELSPYKFNGPDGDGRPQTTQVAAMPDGYRGKYRRDDPEAAQKYAAHVKNAIATIQARGRGVAAFFAESLLGCGGQIVLPDGYLSAAFQHIRAAGGVCIADEVQVGFGRVGSHWWGFETQGVAPDIVTMGKPIGNGHPMAAVVTTREIADAFANGMEYFNTFGGNPVSCAVGLAVLRVIEAENLRENALKVGNYFLERLRELQQKHAIIGDVRGRGLFIGVELVHDRETLEPAAAEAAEIVNRMKERGILLSTDGPLHNIIKIKPPIVFSRFNVDRVVNELEVILKER